MELCYLFIFLFILLFIYVVNTAGEEQHKDMYIKKGKTAGKFNAIFFLYFLHQLPSNNKKRRNRDGKT